MISADSKVQAIPVIGDQDLTLSAPPDGALHPQRKAAATADQLFLLEVNINSHLVLSIHNDLGTWRAKPRSVSYLYQK